MRDKLPVFRPEHPKLCWCKHTADFGMFLSARGCACKFWCGRSSGSKFCIESTFYVFKRPACRLWVTGIKKIDAKPIFTVPDMLPNLASISGTVEMSVASTFLGLNISTCYCLLLVGIILIRRAILVANSWCNLFFWSKTYVQTFTFSMRFCLGKWSSVIFFWFQISTYCCTEILSI